MYASNARLTLDLTLKLDSLAESNSMFGRIRWKGQKKGMENERKRNDRN